MGSKYGPAPSRAGWDFGNVFNSLTAGANKGYLDSGRTRTVDGEWDINLWDRMMGVDERHLENRQADRTFRKREGSKLGDRAKSFGVEVKRGGNDVDLRKRVNEAEAIDTGRKQLQNLGYGGDVSGYDRATLSEKILAQKDINYRKSEEGQRAKRAEDAAAERVREGDKRWSITEQRAADAQINAQADRAALRADNAKDRQMQWMFKQMESKDARDRYDKELALYEKDKQQSSIAALVGALASLGGAFAL